MYYVIGKEIFNEAEVFGIHSNKKIALQQAEMLENNKNKFCCQKYEVKTQTEIKKEKINLCI